MSLSPLTVETLQGATVYPLHVPSAPHVVDLGVFRDDGSLVEDSTKDRHHGTHTFRPTDPGLYSEVKHSTGPAIYAGVFYDHFGHFLLESLARLWCAADHPDAELVWVDVDDRVPTTALRTWQRDMLDVIGVTNPWRVITEPERFDVLHVPDPGWRYADWSHPDHVRFLGAYDGPPQDGTKLWLSRRGQLTRETGPGVGLINSDQIEDRLERDGWKIVQPEKLPLREQLDWLARAEIVAGEEGSAFHTLLLLREISGKKFHVFRRHGPEHISFETIGSARQVDQVFHSTGKDAVLMAEGRGVQRLAPSVLQYLRALGTPISRPRRNTGQQNPTTQRLTRLAIGLGAKSYLQLGTSHAGSFTSLDIAHKDIVDRDSRFDGPAHGDRDCHLFQLSVEDFSLHFRGERLYDLVLIDGVHSGPVAIEYLRAALEMTHPKSVIALANAWPVHEHAAHPDRETSLRLSQEAGEKGKAWQGDVYKAVFALHDLFPELSYRTIGKGANRLVLIWRQPRQKVDRVAPNEAAITAMEYTDCIRHQQVFNFGSENAVLDEVVASLRAESLPTSRAAALGARVRHRISLGRQALSRRTGRPT